MTNYVPILINAVVLIYGGVVDCKRREIPDFVPVTLLLTGIIWHTSLLGDIIGLILPAVLLLAAAKLTGSEILGGDFKLLCALGFANGLLELTAIIVLSALGAMAYGLIRHLPFKRHIPLCTYVAPAYLAFHLTAFALGWG